MASNSINVYAPASPSKYPYTIGANFTESITEDLKNNNKSRITASATLYGKNINYAGTGGTLAIYWYDNNKHTNGTLVASQAIANTSMGVTYTVSGSLDVEHDTDGKLQGYAKAVWTKTASNSYVPPSTNVDTGWQTLTSIARATKIDNFIATIGEPVVFSWTKASANFTHELKLNFKEETIVIGTNLIDNVEWTPDASFYNKLTSKNEDGTLSLTTYNNGVQVGTTQTSTLTLNAKKSVAGPTFTTKKAIDINSTTKTLTGNENILVFFKSQTQLNLVFNTREYATASKLVVNNVEYEIPAGVLQSDKKTTKYTINLDLGTTMANNFNVAITDSRGFVLSDLIINDFVNYIPLDCNSTFKRLGPTSGDVAATFNGNYFNQSFGAKSNTIKITYKYKKKSEETYSSELTLTKGTHYNVSGNKYCSGKSTTASAITLPTNFDYRFVYDGILYVKDELSIIPVNFIVVKGVPIFWWNGEKVVINGDLELADNDGSNAINVSEILKNLHPVGSVLCYEDNTNPNNLFDGEWKLIKSYSGGELIAYASVNAVNGTQIASNVRKSFADVEIGSKTYNVVNYVDGILTGTAGTILVKPQGIVGMVDAEMHVAGMGASGMYGLWWHENSNTLPSGVSMISGYSYLSTGPIGATYGGTSAKYFYKVDNATGEFFVNPTFAPYGGAFTPSISGTLSHLVVKAYAKAGKTYIWKRTA